MTSTLGQDVLDQWWDQEFEIALSQTTRHSFWILKWDWMQKPMPRSSWFMTLATLRPPARVFVQCLQSHVEGSLAQGWEQASLHHGIHLVATMGSETAPTVQMHLNMKDMLRR